MKKESSDEANLQLKHWMMKALDLPQDTVVTVRERNVRAKNTAR